MLAKSFLGLAVAAAVASLSPAIVLAADGDTASMAVRYNDLNLADAADAARLQARMHRAAARVCSTYNDRDLRAAIAEQACRAQAISAAQSQLRVAMAAASATRLAQANASARTGS